MLKQRNEVWNIVFDIDKILFFWQHSLQNTLEYILL